MDNTQEIEKHELTLECVDITYQTIYMYDNTLNKEVSIKYDLSLFKQQLIEVYEESHTHPIFTFYYSNGKYYSI